LGLKLQPSVSLSIESQDVALSWRVFGWID